MSSYGWDENENGANNQDWSDFGTEGAITESDYVTIEENTVYPAVITAIDKIRDLPRKEGKPPTKVIHYTIAIKATNGAGKVVELSRRLREIWLMGAFNGSPPDYSGLMGLARTCMDDDFLCDEDGQPLLDDERGIQWWTNAVLGHSLYVKSRRGKPYQHNGETKQSMIFYVDSPWLEGPRPLEDLSF